MKKIIFNLTLLIVFLFSILIAILSTIGIETNKFNKLISDKVSETKSINLKLETINFKIDLKELSLFLETKKPEILYRGVSVPVQNVKVYLDFLSFIKSDLKIKKASLILQELDVTQLNKLSMMIKPSNFKSLLNNKIKKGKLISEIEIFLSDEGTVENYIAKGLVKDLKIEILEDLNFTNLHLKFFADKKDILIKNIFGDIENIRVSEGDIKFNFDKGIKISSNFDSEIKLNKKFSNLLHRYEFIKNIKNFDATLNNNISIELDHTYKVLDYNYSILGKVQKSKLDLSNIFNNKFLKDEINEIYFSDLKIKSNFKPSIMNFNSEGNYSLDNLNFSKIKLENELKKNSMNLKLDFDYKKDIKLEIINYEKPKKSIANFSVELEKKKDNIKINSLNFKEGINLIKVQGLEFQKSKFLSFDNIEVSTRNNNFSVKKDKKISIKGEKFDATNLAKFIRNQTNKNNFNDLNSNIEIDFNNVKAPMSEKLKNFKLLGKIQKGQFVKISSKGDFGGNNFLDISMKKKKDTDKKYLEVYSDLTRPLLTEYSFFNGLTGGKLLFTSIIDGSKSNSRLKIENFKVINAPGMIKLLSLADLGGLADLVEGEGLSFDVLEIVMEKNKNILNLNEVIALGPSVSVLMEGYQDENGLTSLRGTLVPAKTLNKMISKIPVIGNIVIPKEVGEGLFGISFKMKGSKGNIKTTINPIKTITPRFIQKIIEKNQEIK